MFDELQSIRRGRIWPIPENAQISISLRKLLEACADESSKRPRLAEIAAWLENDKWSSQIAPMSGDGGVALTLILHAQRDAQADLPPELWLIFCNLFLYTSMWKWWIVESGEYFD